MIGFLMEPGCWCIFWLGIGKKWRAHVLEVNEVTVVTGIFNITVVLLMQGAVPLLNTVAEVTYVATVASEPIA